MLVPGSNLLNMAFSAIARQSFQYVAQSTDALNSIGLNAPTYAAPVSTTGSVQAIPKRLYELYGLDLQKTYFNFFLEQTVIDVGRDVSGDQFIFQGNKYQCLSITPWFGIDGWVEVLTILLPS